MPPTSKISRAITDAFAAMGQRREVWDGVERTYLNEKDPTWKGAFEDSKQYPLPMTYVIVDTLASMMMGALQSTDPKWVVKFSDLPVEVVKHLEEDVQMVFESMHDNWAALDDALHQTLLFGSGVLELESVVETTSVPAPIDSRMKPADVMMILSPAVKRKDDSTAEILRSAGIRVVAHDARNVFVYPVEVRNPHREAFVYGVKRYYSQHEVPKSWWKASNFESAEGQNYNPTLGSHIQPHSTSERHRKPFYKGVCRMPNGEAYEFVMNSKKDRLLKWEVMQNVLPVSPYVFLKAIPIHGRWYGKGLGEMLAPLANANSALMSMFMDAVRLTVIPPVGFDQLSHSQLGGHPLQPGDAVVAENASVIIPTPDPQKILTAMSVLREFMDLVAGTGSASYGVSAPQGTATGAGIADRASRMRGNKLFDRMRIPMADIPSHISEFVLKHWGAVREILPFKSHPINFAMPVKWEVNAVSLFSTAEHRQALLMGILDRMLQTIPQVLPDPEIMLGIIRNMAIVMEVPNVASFMKEIEQKLQAGIMPPDGQGIPGEMAGAPPDEGAAGSTFVIDGGPEAEGLGGGG